MLSFATSVVLATAAAASSPQARVQVATDGCGVLSADEVARLLELELSMVTTEIRDGPPLTVDLRCEGQRLTITIIDPLTRKRLARDVPTPAAEPGRERVIALAISQLFAASWLELLTSTPVPPPPPDAPPTPAPQPDAIDAARRAAEASTKSEPEPEPTAARRELELLVGVGGRGRALEQTGRLAATHTEFTLRGWTGPSLGWVGVVGWDFGQATRPLGRVRGHTLLAGGGLAWGYRPGRVGLGGHVIVEGGWARVRGLTTDPDIPTAANAGVTGQARLSVGPRVRYGRLRFDLDAELGAALRSPVGLVDDGPPMTMGGLWAGLVLRLGGSVRSD